MTKSMTAYGQSDQEVAEGIHWNVEIHGVNRKGLDINIGLPKEWLLFDLELRKVIAERISRGKISVRANLQFEKGFSPGYLESLREAKRGWEKAASELKIDAAQITLPFLLEHAAPVDLAFNEEMLKKALLEATDKALTSFIKMREKEGKALASDIAKHLAEIAASTKNISVRAEEIPAIYRDKLLERLKSLASGEIEEERILREVTLFAEKSDITEELTRLESHISQAKGLLKEKTPIGRALEFLVQEMLREFNTIGSKSVSIEITEQVLKGKVTLEKIREQLQNIE